MARDCGFGGADVLHIHYLLLPEALVAKNQAASSWSDNRVLFAHTSPA